MLPTNARPAAQYLRMSTDTQEFSIENQKAEIKRYADRLGYRIVRTYCDAGKTGLTLKYRPGLKELLKDVLSGSACFEAILVFDVSRWGRFQDDNEAAHYEFLCKRSGVSVHYCAESFTNDGSVASGLLKNLKRVMAKEYSRELGVKVYAGQERIARMGFKIGGTAGFGLRRIMLSKDGTHKRRLENGEYKSLKTDRVKLVLGPRKEVECVRRMFSMALHGMGCSDIARALNKEAVTRENGDSWNCEVVRTILTHPKYSGCSVWGQSSQKLHGPNVPQPRERWIIRPDSFPAVVDTETFNRVQKRLAKYAADLFWSDEELLTALRQLWVRKGKLSEWLIDSTRGMPTYSTIQRRFGTLRHAYEIIGYRFKTDMAAACVRREQMCQLRNKLIEQVQQLFPSTTVFRLPGKIRPTLKLDNETNVCVRVCVARRVMKTIHWDFRTSQAENGFCTLLAKSNLKANGFHSMYVMPPRKWVAFYRFSGEPKWLAEGIRLNNLTELPDVVRRLSTDRLTNRLAVVSDATPKVSQRPHRTLTKKLTLSRFGATDRY